VANKNIIYLTMHKTSSKNLVRNAFEFLEKFTNYERALRYPYNGWAMNLERVRLLLSSVGSPEKTLKAIHIAGTKGKGSTSKMVQSILTSAGFRVGLYTSPHLLKVNERITINNSMITDIELARAILELKDGVDAVKKNPGLGELTYFELITAVAFYYFARKKVDYAVLETGLGGRYDATNVCEPVLVILTPISYDHTDILGKTLSQIALEKAMIIKPGVEAVISVQPGPARRVFEKRAKEIQVRIFPVEKFYQWRLRSIKPGEMVFDLRGKRELKNLRSRMVGARQMVNCACAVLAVDLLEGYVGKVSDEAIRKGIWSAVLGGRFQEIEFRGRKIIVDGAHNKESARALMETIAMLYPGYKLNFIAGLSRDKDIEGFFSELKCLADRIIISQARIQRAATRETMERALKGFKGEIVFEPSLRRAMRYVLRSSGKGGLIVITGSFYLAGEALEWLKEQGIKIRTP